MTRRLRRRLLRCGMALGVVLLCSSVSLASALCTAARDKPLTPVDPRRCAELADVVRKPRALPLDRYQARLAEYFRNFCHRDEASGWTHDKRVRDTGPFLGTLKNGKWEGAYHGTHAPVVTWYSPDMVEWLKANRREERTTAEPPPVPDGAIIPAATDSGRMGAAQRPFAAETPGVSVAGCTATSPNQRDSVVELKMQEFRQTGQTTIGTSIFLQFPHIRGFSVTSPHES